MTQLKKIKSALISVYYKDRLDELVKMLAAAGVEIYSTGGTQQFIEELGIKVSSVESLTTYPSILGGRVKTLHPKVFGGILARRQNESDQAQMLEYAIPEIDLVIVDLYPFEATLASGASDADIIEKIDIGGISLIRAAAKNYQDVIIVSRREQYSELIDLFNEQGVATSLENRRKFAREAFNTSSHYDAAIFNYFDAAKESEAFKVDAQDKKALRYGENPHQKGCFYGPFEDMFEQLHGKEISYNNLLDIDAAVSLISEFQSTTIAVLKHNNACGLASRPSTLDAWKDALAGDPLSAFGGVIISNAPIDEETAVEINKIFFEIIIAPAFSAEALEVFKTKKDRIVLIQKKGLSTAPQYRSVLNGILVQDRDLKAEAPEELKVVTTTAPTSDQINDLLFANKIVKHSKSNAIVFAHNGQLFASGVGQTSRVDAVKHAIEKAKNFGFDLSKAVMASDAFFPFPDSVQFAAEAGIKAVIQPGGSKNDSKTIEYCNENGVAMVVSGFRHFKH